MKQSTPRSISIFLVGSIVTIVAIPFFIRASGYYINYPGWEVGEIAAAKKDPKICYKLKTFLDIFGPPGPVRRADCIVRYAPITHDPISCELMMPSEYGLFCVNETISKEFKNEAEAEHVEYDTECDGIKNYPLKEDNCMLIRAHRSHKPSDCDSINNDVIRTGCQIKMEAWQKYPQLRSSDEYGKNREV